MGYANWHGPPWGGIKMDFTGGVLNVNYQSGVMDFNCTNGVICDRRGNLLFCSNGIYIANAQFDTMQNGGGINPGFYTTQRLNDGLAIPQGNLIIPLPNDTDKYYLFHETSDDYGNTYCTLNLYYSIIDMTLDNGKGAVTQKNVVLLNDSLVGGRLTACKHANGRDWWLIAHQFNSNRYYKYLFTPFNIILGPFIQDIGVQRGINFGQVVFSPDGNKFANYEPTGDLDILDFDRCTGDFSNLIHVDINDTAGSGGVAFSPNSRVLYVSSMNYVYQFDMTASDIPSSQTTVAVYDGYYSPQFPLATSFYLSQLAPDGKIYINCGNGTVDIHVINYPDSVGLACDLCQHCIHLPAYNGFTIANHPNYFLGAESGSICDSLTTSVQSLSVQSLKLELFPNPVFNENITLTYNVLHEPGLLIINNIEGKEVISYNLPQWSSVQHLKLPKLSGGIYIARLLSNKSSADVKFFVE